MYGLLSNNELMAYDIFMLFKNFIASNHSLVTVKVEYKYSFFSHLLGLFWKHGIFLGIIQTP